MSPRQKLYRGITDSKGFPLIKRNVTILERLLMLYNYIFSPRACENTIRQILIDVRARNKRYNKSPTFSMTVNVPERNFADNLLNYNSKIISRN